MKKVTSLLLLFLIFSCGIVDDDILHTHIELQELYDKLTKSKEVKELDDAGFITLSDKGGHYTDCLAWILERADGKGEEEGQKDYQQKKK